MKRIVLMQVVMALILAAATTAGVPQMINYQGRLTDSGGDPLPDTTLNVTFSIYRSTGVLVWTSGAQPVQLPTVFSIMFLAPLYL